MLLWLLAALLAFTSFPAYGGLVFIGGKVVGIDDVTISDSTLPGGGVVDIVFDYGTQVDVNSNIASIAPSYPLLPYTDSLAQAVANAIAAALNGPPNGPPVVTGTNPLRSFFEVHSQNVIRVPATGQSAPPTGQSAPPAYVVSHNGTAWIRSTSSYSPTDEDLLAFVAAKDFFNFTNSPIIPEPTSAITLAGMLLMGAVALRRRLSSSHQT
jgi:hypothetical protein